MQEFPRTLKILTVYGLVFVVLFLALQWWQQQQRKPQVVIDAQSGMTQIVLPRDRSGHYFWTGKINGQEVEFLVDTGATQTAISKDLADALGLREEGSSLFNTANGTVRGGLTQATIALEGGLRFERQRISIMPQMERTGLLGMDVLGQLQLEQQGKQLRITAQRKL